MATNNQAVATATTRSIMSLRDFQNQPDVYNKLFKAYGEDLKFMNFLHSSPDRVRPMASRTTTGEEENFTQRTFKLGIIGTTSAGQSVVKLDADEFDTNGNYFPRLGETVLVGSTITGFTECRIDSISTDAAPDTTFTLKRYDTTKPGLDAHVTAGTLAAGVELPIGAFAFAEGTGQPNPTNVGTTQRSFEAQIIKEAIGFEGATLAQQKWISDNEGSKLFNHEIARAEFKLEAQQEMMCFMGQSNSANLTQTSLVSGGQNKIGKNKGVWTWAEELGGDILIGSTGMGVDDLDTIVNYMTSKGISDPTVALYGGKSGLMKLMSNVTAKLQGTSGGLAGSPYVQEVADKLFGGNAVSANFDVEYIKRGGVTFILIPSPIFSNPKYLGVSTTLLSDAILAVPLNMVTVTVDRQKATIPNLSKRFVGLDGYSRERIVGMIGGMDGYMNQKYNYPIISQVDGNSTYWLSDICFEYYEAYRSMIIKRSA